MHTMHMATVLVGVLVIILVLIHSSESKHVLPAILPSNTESTLAKTPLDVFQTGKFHPRRMRIDNSCSPPRRLLIFRPEENGTYPVILFHHGTGIQNSWYTNLLKFISSHGYIVVAPQLYGTSIPPSSQSELNLSAKVANWLPSGLPCVLPENVGGNLDNLALAGHSRGGYIAFALALGLAEVPVNVHFSALVGVDPVAGTSKDDQLEPKILNYEPCSLDLPPMPVAIIGTGLGNVPAFIFPPTACAPDGVSHAEFFNECKPPCSHFVTADYGHMDMLDDDIGLGYLLRILCKGSRRGMSRDPMRSTVGGIVVAFLEAFFRDDFTDYNSILRQPNHFAPATLDVPIQNKTSCSTLTAM